MKFNYMNEYQTEEVARIHHETLPNDFLPRLGREFLKFFYDNSILSDCGRVIVWTNNMRVVGFIVVCEDRNKFYNDILWERWWVMPKYVLSKLLSIKNIKYFMDVLLEIRRSGGDLYNTKAEIAFIAVEEGFRRFGVASRLLKEAEKYLDYEGVERYTIKVNVKNEKMNEFCNKKKFKLQNQTYFLGKDWYIYMKEVSSKNP